MLFGNSSGGPASPAPQKARANSEPPRRILESLIAPPPEPPVAEEIGERPRRGRKPGSKNKPKVADGAAVAPAPAPRLSAEALAFMRVPQTAVPAERHPASPAPEVPDEVGGVPAGQSRRGRLRERSNIIKRYVLGIEPSPGKTGSLRARKRIRAAG